jgi:hypothetical protein
MANQERPVVAAARKRRIGVQAALSDLERAVAAGSAQREQDWATGLASSLTRLQDAFVRHIEATESNDGLFADVIEQAPRLAHQVGQLRADHPAIEQSIHQALVLVADPAGIDPTRISAAGEAVLDLMSSITRHRHLGASLVYEAYNVDIEASD